MINVLLKGWNGRDAEFLTTVQMVNFLPHMDIIPVQTLNRINLLLGKAQQELARQFERKVLDFSVSGQKYEDALAQLKQSRLAPNCSHSGRGNRAVSCQSNIHPNAQPASSTGAWR